MYLVGGDIHYFSDFLYNLCTGFQYCIGKNFTIQIGEGTDPDLRRIWRNVMRSEAALRTLAEEIGDFMGNYSTLLSYVNIIGKSNTKF